MSKRHAQSSSKRQERIANSDTLTALERQVMAIARQLGRIAASVEARAGSQFDRPEFQAQIQRIRERAARLVEHLGGNSESADARKALARAQSREKVAAPGKKHRKAPAPSRSIKHSDEALTKALAVSRRRTSRPRQG